MSIGIPIKIPTPVRDIIVPKIMFNNPMAFLLGSQLRGKTNIIKNRMIQKISIYFLI